MQSSMTQIQTLTQYHEKTVYCESHNAKSKRKIVLIVEGGGMRTIFSAGVLDSFIELGFDPFHVYFGVSAGSLNLISYLAGQYLRNYRVVMFGAKSGEFINSWKYLRGGHYIDLDWLTTKCLLSHPLDEQAAIRKLEQFDKEFFIVCTNFETGKANYHRPNENNIYNLLTGSCCIPLLYRDPVHIAGERVFDGGIGDPLPVKKAYEEGATDIVVIRSRDIAYRQPYNSLEQKIGSILFRQYPMMQDSILGMADTYNKSIEFIESPPVDVNIYHITPFKPLGANLVTTDPQLLEVDYQQGKELGRQFVWQWNNKLENRTESISQNYQTPKTGVSSVSVR